MQGHDSGAAGGRGWVPSVRASRGRPPLRQERWCELAARYVAWCARRQGIVVRKISRSRTSCSRYVKLWVPGRGRRTVRVSDHPRRWAPGSLVAPCCVGDADPLPWVPDLVRRLRGEP